MNAWEKFNLILSILVGACLIWALIMAAKLVLSAN